MVDTETLRRSFRPDHIKMLMVGESAPAGGTFFYRANSTAYHEIRKAFGREGDADFLGWFKAQGFYLDDLVLTPINNSRGSERQRACEAGIAPLAERIRSYAPRMVIAFKKSICLEVSLAVGRSGTDARYHCTHFPGVGQQAKFQDDMARILPLIRGL